jgi:hypothetical protein
MVVTVMYGRGSGVGVPIGDLRSKNNTCPGLSDASPELATTQCRLQSAVCPLTISRHCAAGSLAISAATVSALGPSAWVQVAELGRRRRGRAPPTPRCDQAHGQHNCDQPGSSHGPELTDAEGRKQSARHRHG